MIPSLKIRSKLTLVFVAFAAAILSGLGTFAYYNGRSALLDATISDLVSSALEKEKALDYWIQERRRTVVRLSLLPSSRESVAALIEATDQAAIGAARRRLNAAFQQWTGRLGAFGALMVLHPESGEVVFSTVPSRIGTFKENRRYFTESRGGTFVQAPYFSVTLRAPAMTISTPMTKPDGTLLSVLAGRLKIDEMNAIVSRRTGRKKTDDAYLVNGARLLVTQPRLIDDPSVLKRGIHSRGIRRCVSGQSGHMLEEDFRRVPVVSVFRWLGAYQLCLMVKISQAEAFQASRSFGMTTLAATILTLLAAGLIASSMARRLSLPVISLKRATTAVREGDLSVQLTAMSEDELGDLARDFNAMTAALAEKEARIRQNELDLEDKVKKRTQQLEDAQEELAKKEKLAVLGQLTATVSHELRNPLGAMRISMFTVRNFLPVDNERSNRAADRVERNITRCDQIIDELLDFTRIRDLHLEPRLIDDWLGDCLDDLHLRDGFTIHRDLNLSGVMVGFDEDRLRRAIINVIDNACDAVAERRAGGDDDDPSMEITVRTASASGQAEIVVRDTGVGIPDDVMARIFEPLFSTKGFGVGLGMPVVKQIMEQHGGGIRVFSRPGEGTTVVLWLPMDEAMQAAG